MSRPQEEPIPTEPSPPRAERARAPRVEGTFLLVLLCFFLSGAAALLYETVWTRQFALVFGTSELAVATVLAAYMGGLAAGAAMAGRWAGRVRRPLLAYGLLELGIAGAALLVPSAIRASTALSVALFGGRSAPPDASGLSLSLFYLACSFAILLIPTAFMGATLPLLMRFSVRRESEIGPRSGVLYATNTLGAVCGTVVAAFVLLPRLGLLRTVLVGGGINALAFVLATVLAIGGPAVPGRPRSPASGEAAPVAALGRRRVILPLILISGIASFTYEVLWTRLLSHLLGGSIYAFAAMLASFLTGIALGSAVASRLATTPTRAARGFGVAQLASGILSWGAFLAADRLPGLAAQLGAGAAAALARNAAMAALVLLPATLSIGATFPFAVRILARHDADAGSAGARVYAWNTVGAIVGAVGSGFFLIPLLGYAGIVTAAVAVNLALAATTALLLTEPPARRIAIAAALALVGLAVWRPTTPWGLIAASPLPSFGPPAKPFYVGVGRSATVTLTWEGRALRLRTNGLPEGRVRPAGQRRGSFVEVWLGALPSVARPETRSMLMIGLGAGAALEAIPETVASIDVVELEPEVIEANRLMSPRRSVDPLADPRVHLHVNDARGALVLTGTRYDAVVSQPSHPWTAGASHLYTREFFALVRDHLVPGGVFVQWIDVDFTDEVLLRSLVATMLDVFPSVRMYRPVVRSGVLLVASDRPLALESTAAGAIAAAPEMFLRAAVQTPEDVAAALALDEDAARRFADGAPISTDDYNLFQTRSPQVLRAPLGRAGADRLLAPFDPLPALSHQLDRLYLVRRLIADGFSARAVSLVSTMRDPVEWLVGRGLVLLAEGRTTHGARRLDVALRSDPDRHEARVALLRVHRRALLANEPWARRLAEPLQDPATAVIEAWRLEATRDWDGLARLDERLALAQPYDPIYPDALRLRAVWRIASDDPARATEAMALLDRMLPLSTNVEDRELRMRAWRLVWDRSPP